MRVLLPFYRRYSSENSSSGEEEEEEIRAAGNQAAAKEKQSSVERGEAVRGSAAREERQTTSKTTDKPKEKASHEFLEKEKYAQELVGEDFVALKQNSEPQPPDEKLPAKSSKRDEDSKPQEETPQAPFTSRSEKKQPSFALIHLENADAVAAAHSQDTKPKKRPAADSCKRQTIESGSPLPLLACAPRSDSEAFPSSPTVTAAAALAEVRASKAAEIRINDKATATFATAKRPRTDSKPPAKLLANHQGSPAKMAVGSKRRNASSGHHHDDSDEDEEDVVPSFAASSTPSTFWVQPAENEPPPVIQNHPNPQQPVPLVASAAVASSSNPDDPAQEDLREVQPVAAAAAAASKQQKLPPSLEEFQRNLKEHGLEMVEQEGDGNCLFRAVSLQVYGHSDNHAEVRERCLDFMAQNEEHYSAFVATTEDEDGDLTFQDYVARKRGNGVHGNNPEIQAISELYNRPVEVYTADSAQPMNIFHAEYKTSDPPIRLSYHDGNHYNAVIDPLLPTA